MRILPTWLHEFVTVAADNRQLAEDLTSAGIAVESVAEENGETIYEMDLTTNRVDAMNHYGIAREASAIYGVELEQVKPNLPGGTAGPSTAAAKNAPPTLGMTPGEEVSLMPRRVTVYSPSSSKTPKAAHDTQPALFET